MISSKYLPGLALPGADDHVQRVDLVHLELVFLDLLLEVLLGDDDLVPVDDVLLQLVGQNSLKSLHFVALSNFTDEVGHLVVGLPWLQQSQGSIDGVVGGQDDVGLPSLHHLLFLDNHSVGNQSHIPVNLHSEVNLDDVSVLDYHFIFFGSQWGIVSADLVHYGNIIFIIIIK